MSRETLASEISCISIDEVRRERSIRKLDLPFYFFFENTAPTFASHRQLVSWLTRSVDCALPRGQWAHRLTSPSSPKGCNVQTSWSVDFGAHSLIKRRFLAYGWLAPMIYNSSSTLAAFPRSKCPLTAV